MVGGRKVSFVQESQPEYLSPHDPTITKLLAVVRTLDAESKKAVLKYAEEKSIILNMKNRTPKPKGGTT
jgi:hypothetical protein